MSITIPWLNFFRLWMLTPLLGSLITSATLWISITKQSPKFYDMGIVAYWLLLGIFQWRILKPHVSWAYQWGLVTAIFGIVSFWFSGLLWTYITAMSDIDISILDSQGNDLSSLFYLVFSSIIFTYLNGVIGSFLKGSIFYKILSNFSNRN